MNKIDTSPEALRALANSIDYLSDREFNRNIVDALCALAYEKEAAEKSNVAKVDFIEKTLVMKAPLGWDNRQAELSKLAVDAKAAPFLDIHREK